MSSSFDTPMVGCEEVDRFGEAWADGELDTGTAAGMESHGRACTDCQEKLDALKAYKQSLRNLVSIEVAPRALEDAIFGAPRRASRRRIWGNVALAAAAAGFSFFSMVGFRAWWERSEMEPSPRIASAEAEGDEEDVLESMVVVARQHEQLPMDVEATAYDDVQTLTEFFGPRLSFPVRLPESAVLPVHYAGGRVTRWRDRDAAYLRIQSPRGTVSVFVYPRQDARQRANPVIRAVGNYSAAQWAHDGLSYSAIGEMPDTDLEAVLTAFQEP